MKETKDNLSFYMWRDGHNGLNVKANRIRAAATKELIRDADLLTVTTKELGKSYRDHRPTGPIAVLPNLVDLDRYPEMFNDTDDIRIAWQGGAAHYHDLHLVAQVIKDLMDKYDNLKLCMLGMDFKGLWHGKEDRVEYLPWHSDIYSVPLHYSEMKADIGICPLTDKDKFNKGKSAVKWMEFSAMKVPCVCSRTVYGNVVNHTKTGFIADTKQEWTKYLEMLITDAQLRKDIATRAHTRVKEYHNVDKSEMWFDAYSDLFKKDKKVLSYAGVKNR